MLEVLKEFQGILGTILGVVVTLITTEFIRRTGRVRLYPSNTSIKFQKEINNLGSVQKKVVDDFNLVDIFNYSFELAFYNASDIPRSYYDVHIKFIDVNNKKFTDAPYDESKKEFKDKLWRKEEVTLIELEPKKLHVIVLYGWIRKDKLLEFTNTTKIKKVYLVARNHKNKKFFRKIYG